MERFMSWRARFGAYYFDHDHDHTRTLSHSHAAKKLDVPGLRERYEERLRHLALRPAHPARNRALPATRAAAGHLDQ